MARPCCWRLGAAAALAVALATQAAAQTTSVCYDSCELANQTAAYERYSASSAVKQNAPDKEFPRKGGGQGAWQDYAISAATPSVILLVLCCCCCCCMCCYVWRLRTRLDHDIGNCCCVPGTPSEKWATDRRVVAWLLLITAGVAWFILITLSYTYNTELTDNFKEIPHVLNVYAEYLDGPVTSALECVIGRADSVVSASNNLLSDPNIAGNSTAEAIVNEIIGYANNFSSVLNNSKDGVLKGVDDAAQQIRDASNEADDWTTEAGGSMNAFTYTCLTIVLIIGLVNVGMAAFVARHEGTRAHCYTTLACVSSVMVVLMWLLLLLCAIVLLVLRLFGGYCEAPFEILNSYVGSDNATDQATYYLTCGQMTDAQREANWPFETERTEISNDYNQINTLRSDLESTGANLTELNYATDQLSCTITADYGLLGYNGIFSCGLMDRFLHQIVIQLCSKMYEPVYSLYLCLLFLALLIIFTVWNQQVIRREAYMDEEAEMDKYGRTTALSPTADSVVSGDELFPNQAYEGPNGAQPKGQPAPPSYSDAPPYSDGGGGEVPRQGTDWGGLDGPPPKAKRGTDFGI